MTFCSNEREGLVSQASKGASEAGLSGGSPEQLRHDIRSPDLGRGEGEQGPRQLSSYNLAVTTLVQDLTIPLCRTRPASSASLSPSGFLLSSGPPSGRAPERNPLHSQPPGGPRARPPASAKVSSCPQPKDAGPGRASQAPPGPTCETGEGSARRPAGATSHGRRREEAEGSEGSARPTSGRKRQEPETSGITLFRTWHRRRRRRSVDINQEDAAKDHRTHERPDIKGRAPQQSFKELQPSAESLLSSCCRSGCRPRH